MMPITNFFIICACPRRLRVATSCTVPSCEDLRHRLFAASNMSVAGIAREVFPARNKRALDKFLTEYDWDEQEFNHERLE